MQSGALQVLAFHLRSHTLVDNTEVERQEYLYLQRQPRPYGGTMHICFDTDFFLI